jgi:hypothetical protein
MAQITSFTVDGVEVAAARMRDGSLTYDNQINGRSVLECSLIDKTISPVSPYIPTVRDTVYLEIDNVPVFGGILWVERVGNIAGPVRGVHTRSTFTDYKALLDRVYFNGPIAGGSLASQLAPLITNMAPHGITLSASQETGPTMVEQGFNFLTIRQCLDALSAQTILDGGTTWIYTISPTGVFRMYEAGTQACPFNLSESVGNYRSASWSVDLNSYVNNIYARYGPPGLALISETFTGDGSTQTFTLSLPLVIAETGVAPSGYVIVTRDGPAVTNENIDAEPDTGPAQWHYDATENTLIQDDSGIVLESGETVLISYYVVGPFTLFEGDDAEYAEFGPFTDVISMPEVTDTTLAQATLEAELARRLGLAKKLTVLTDQAGAEPFQTITCTMPSLDVSGDYLITEVSLVEVAVNRGGSGVREFAFELQCLEGNRYRGNWELFWRPEPRTQGSTGLYTQTPTTPTEDTMCTVSIFADDFNGANTLATDGYTGVDPSISKVAAIGPDGSQAVRSTGEFQEFTRPSIASTGLTGCCGFSSKTSIDGGFFYVAEIRRSSFWFLSIYRNDSGGDNALEVYTNQDGSPVATVNDFWDETAWIDVLIRWQLSTYNGSSYEFDGYVQVLKDDVVMVDLQNIQLESGFGLETWDTIVLAPQGDMDNLAISEGA